MEFISRMRETESDFMGFKSYGPIIISEEMALKIKANSLSLCTPKEDLDLGEYTEMEFSVDLDDKNVKTTDFFPESTEYEQYLQEGNIYGNVPVDLIEKLYLKLTATGDVENDDVEHLEKKTESLQSNSINKKKITRKQGVKKINEIKDALNKKFFEREDEIEGMLVALLSGQHVLLVGEPGTGKSLLSMELAKIIDGSSYFQWLLTKYTTPEELFGALSLKELEKGIHYRNVNGKLPEAHFAFLDEIFKANSAILNSLLTLINERLYYNNGTPIESPLISLIGASNEYPEEDEGLEAMFDRLLLRYEVKQIRNRKNFISMLKNEGSNTKIPTITLDELITMQEYVSKINVSDNIYENISNIVMELEDEGIYPSARRVKNSIKTIQAKAFMDNRNNVEEKDLAILYHILWNEIHERDEAVVIIKKYAQDIVGNTIERIENEMQDLLSQHQENRKDGNVNEDVIEIASKLKSLSEELNKLSNDNPDRHDEIININNEIERLQKSIIDEVIVPIS